MHHAHGDKTQDDSGGSIQHASLISSTTRSKGHLEIRERHTGRSRDSKVALYSLTRRMKNSIHCCKIQSDSYVGSLMSMESRMLKPPDTLLSCKLV